MKNYILKNPILEQEVFGSPKAGGTTVQSTDTSGTVQAKDNKDAEARRAAAAAAAAKAKAAEEARKAAEEAEKAKAAEEARKAAEEAEKEKEKLKKEKERRDAEAEAKARAAAARASNRAKKRLKEIKQETDPDDDATPWWLWAGGVIGGLWAGKSYLNYRKMKKLTRAVEGVADAQSQLVKVVEPVVKATEKMADAIDRSADAAQVVAGTVPKPEYRPIFDPGGNVVSQVKVEFVKTASDDVYRAAAEALPEPEEASKMRRAAQRAAAVIEKIKGILPRFIKRKLRMKEQEGDDLDQGLVSLMQQLAASITIESLDEEGYYDVIAEKAINDISYETYERALNLYIDSLLEYMRTLQGEGVPVAGIDDELEESRTFYVKRSNIETILEGCVSDIKIINEAKVLRSVNKNTLDDIIFDETVRCLFEQKLSGEGGYGQFKGGYAKAGRDVVKKAKDMYKKRQEKKAREKEERAEQEKFGGFEMEQGELEDRVKNLEKSHEEYEMAMEKIADSMESLLATLEKLSSEVENVKDGDESGVLTKVLTFLGTKGLKR
jgi:hypothetical protein